MRNFFSEASTQKLSFFWCALLIIGLFVAEWVRVLPSIGVAGLFLTSLGYRVIGHSVKIERKHWPMLSLVWVFGLHVASALLRGSPFDKLVQQDIVLQLPFLLLPISFVLLPDWPNQYKRWLWLLLIACCLIAAAGATANYMLHSQQIEQTYLQSKVMPTEPDHIRFSLLISIAVMIGLVLLQAKNVTWKQHIVVAIAVVLLFLFQHLLAVRSGLISMYIAGIVWLGWLGIYLKQWKKVGIILTVAAFLAGASLLCFPTLQNKITNTRSDAQQIETVEAANNYSVTARVYSYQVAWVIIKEHPWFGVGKIALADKMAEQYSYMFPEIESDRYILPHNQFIYNLTAYGAIGLLIFLLSFYYPVWCAIKSKNIEFLLIYLIISLSFIVEYTLESHIGLLIGIFFALLAMTPTDTLPSAKQIDYI